MTATYANRFRSLNMRPPFSNALLSAVIFLMIFFGIPAHIVSADQLFTPNIHPTLAVPKITGPIKIDGGLDDSGWKNAAVASGFCEYYPGDMTKPPVRTDVLVAYDNSNFYMGFIAYDDPKQLRISMRQRDEAWQDDDVGIILDTYGDAAWAYEIFCNAIGVRGMSAGATAMRIPASIWSSSQPG